MLKDEYSYNQEGGYGGGYDREHMVPDKVKKVMAYMQDMIADRNINEVRMNRWIEFESWRDKSIIINHWKLF